MTVLLSYGFRSFHLAVGNFPCDIRKQSRGYVDAFDINASHLRLLLFFRHCFLSPFKGIVSLLVKYYSINGVLKSIVNFIKFKVVELELKISTYCPIQDMQFMI